MAFNLFGTKDEKMLQDKLNKIIWFSARFESYDYILVYGERIETSFDRDDIIILYYLFNMIVKSRNLNVNNISMIDNFAGNIKMALSWVKSDREALFIKYRPSLKVQKAYKNFDSKRIEYKKSIGGPNTDITYNELVQAFVNLFDAIE